MVTIAEAYRVLGIRRGASLAEITRAYRTLAKRHHPDFNPQDPQSAHRMMMRVNEAYSLVKEDSKRTSYEEYDRAYELYRMAEEERRRAARASMQQQSARANVKQQAGEKLRRERESLNQYWEEVLKERRREESDSGSFDVIMENTSILISYFYQQGLHNPVFRYRPYGRLVFDKYAKKFRQFTRRCYSFSKSCTSAFYRRKTLHVYAFLETFMGDVRDIDHAGLEKRPQAGLHFEKAVRASDRLIEGLFTDDSLTVEDEKRMLRESLDMFASFLRTYPDSPLIGHAESRVDVLEKLYQAFLSG